MRIIENTLHVSSMRTVSLMYVSTDINIENWSSIYYMPDSYTKFTNQ